MFCIVSVDTKNDENWTFMAAFIAIVPIVIVVVSVIYFKRK